MNDQEIFSLDEQYVLRTYERAPLVFVKGEGARLTDQHGKVYLDFLSGIGVNALGYAHPDVIAAMKEQMKTGILHTSNLFHNPWQARLAQKLCQISRFDKAFLANTGTEAWEGALKLARLYARGLDTEKAKAGRVLAMSDSFHGRTFGSLSTTGQAKYREPFAPVLPNVEFVAFNDVRDLVRKTDKSVTAICLETIQGEGGIVPATKEFMTAARELADSVGALLICDEIQCGLGRTGKWFAYEHFGVRPDVVTVAKPIAGGLPCAAILMSAKVAASMSPGMHGTTFGGGPLACAVGLATLETIEREKLLQHATKMGEYVHERLLSMQQEIDIITDVRVFGLMIGIEVQSAAAAKEAVAKMLDRGIIINRTHDTTLRMLPPYIVTQREIEIMLTALQQVLDEIASKLRTVPAEGENHGKQTV